MNNTVLIRLSIWLIPLFIVPKAFAVEQCFTDAQHAYAYLMGEGREKDKRAVNSQPPSSANATTNTINLNTASEAQLISLQGIGSKKAQAIIVYRQQKEAFNSVEDLTKVKGIGEKTLQKNRSRLSVN